MNAKHLHNRMVLSFVWCHSGFQLEQRERARAMGHCKEIRGVLGHSPGEPGTKFCNYGISPRQTGIVFSLHDPKSKWIYSPIAKKQKTTNKKKPIAITKHKKKIPVISRLQWAVNINNRNVQVESVGWRFPHALRATWELHASVHEPTVGTSLFQICVTAFAYISILSCFSVLCFLFFFRLSSELQRWQCRLVAPPSSAGPLVAMLRQKYRLDLSLCWWIKISTP